MTIGVIGIDADDTLWHSETVFRVTQDRLLTLLAPYADRERITARLLETERRNLATYGYGVKGFTLSMIETAIELTEAQVPASVLSEILAAGRAMMSHPVEALEGVEEALPQLAEIAPLVLITKGDLFHQESKLAASGLGRFFQAVEIVSEKTSELYARVFARHGVRPERAAMVGNSVRSDILPALEIGAFAALIPYPLVWEHEAGLAPADHPRFRQFERLDQAPNWLAELDTGAAADAG